MGGERTSARPGRPRGCRWRPRPARRSGSSSERPEAEVGPVQVDRPADGPRARVDDAGRADADAEEGGPVIGAQGVDKLEDELDGGVAVASFEGQVDRAQDVAAQVDDGAAELRLAEVEADQVTAVRGDAQQDR